MQENISFQFYFTLFCEKEFDFSVLSSLLNIQPSMQWIKDRSHPKPLYKNESFWKVTSKEIFNFTFDNFFIEFINPFIEKSNILVNFIETYNIRAKIDVVIKIHSGNTMPGISIPKEIIHLLSKWDCSIDFDIYDFRIINR